MASATLLLLSLTKVEAESLLTVLNRVGGNLKTTRRKHIEPRPMPTTWTCNIQGAFYFK